jgi:hypothetical protein
MINLLLLSILSAILYRAGGLSKEAQEKWSKWIPKWMRHTSIRDWLCPLCCVGVLLPYINSLADVGMVTLFYGATGGLLTTYWDEMFGFDNFWFSGFAIGLAGLFLIPLGIAWQLLVLRAFLLAILWGGWCAYFGDADVEEYGRGFFLVITMLILKGGV